MNILYIGPYRLNTSIGYESLNALLELHDKYTNIVSRPIYYQESINKLDDIENLLSKTENNTIKNFDIVIQHTVPESFVYNAKINKHIFIPIFQNKLNDNYQKQICRFLETKGSFVINNIIDDFILKDSSVKNSHFVGTSINNRLSKVSQGTFNFGLYNSYKKYYTITHSSYIRNIKNLIINFIKNNNEDHSCLILFMQGVSQSAIDTYNAFIKSIYQNLNIKYSISRVILIPIELNNYTISTIHSCSDIYIDINNDIHKHYAAKYNKPIICNTSKIILYDDYNNLDSLNIVSNKEPIDLSNIQTLEAPSVTLDKIITNNV